jgi:diaminopimelate epimerase
MIPDLFHLTKHHGLGNDFLVVDTTGIGDDAADWAERARQWCGRRIGVGADGLLLLGIESDDVLRMQLYNADGSRAEISGNGIRCLSQAALMIQQRQRAKYLVHTEAGDRFVEVWTTAAAEVQASVGMGRVTAGIEPVGWEAIGADPMRPVSHLSLGNPHTVVGVEEVDGIDLQRLGAYIPQTNLEVVEPGDQPHSIRMRVHERGAGITQACGSGACASAWAAQQWGLATALNGEILVKMDGGDATVRLNDPEHGDVTLIGPSVFIARIEIEGR